MAIKTCAKNKFSFKKYFKAKSILLVKICLFIILFSAFCWSYYQLTDPALFPVNHVSIYGEYKKIAPQALKQAIVPNISKGFFAFNVNMIQQEIEAIAWVKQCTVYRRWPDELVVEIIQKKPLAVWNDKALVDDKKEFFFPDRDTFPKNLPLLYGPKKLFKEVDHGFEEMNNILKPLGLSIVEISMDQRHSWRVRLNNEIYLIIGHMDYHVSLKNFVKSYEKIIAKRVDEVNYVDLRYHNGVAVHWKKSTTFV